MKNKIVEEENENDEGEEEYDSVKSEKKTTRSISRFEYLQCIDGCKINEIN